MGKLHACFVVGVLALAAACGDDGAATKMDAAVDAPPDAKVFMDAPPPMFDLTCAGNNPPAAAANVTLGGSVQQANLTFPPLMFTVDPVDGANVKACDTAACNGPADGSDTSDPTGAWSIGPIATGGTGLADYIEMTATNVRTTYVYPHAPFVADQPNIPVLTFGPGVEGVIGSIGTCDAADPLIAVAVTDCANMPITDTANINITVKQGGVDVASAEVHDLSTAVPMAPPEIAGLFLICGVPAANAITLGATYNGTTFLAHDVKTVADTTTTTQLRPGY